MNKGVVFVLVLTLIFLPSVYALNCTLFTSSKNDLCNNINPLELNENDKFSLMQDNIYGSINEEQEPINITLNLQNQEVKTTKQLYEENVSMLVKLCLFIFVNYSVFSFLTKSSKIIKWLNAVY